MNEFKGTKGEWFSCCTNAKPHFLFADNGETTICSFFQKQDDGTILNIEEVRANAKLISCAPEMLEMLIKLNDFCTMKIEDRNKLEELIEKATCQ